MPGSLLQKARSGLEMDARLFRRGMRRSARRLRYGKAALQDSPVLFANSFPKSGTHLLTQVLAGFARLGPAVVSGLPAIVTFRGDTGSQRPLGEILADINRLLPGDIAYGHLHALPEVIRCFLQDGFAAFFILRDPRDVAVSHVHYLTDMAPEHVHHHYFAEQLPDFDSRLFASIQGVPAEKFSAARANGEAGGLEPLPDIRSRFEPYLAWFDHPQVLALRYEDFLSHRLESIGRVLDHAVHRGFQLHVPPAQAVQILDQGIDPSRSPTFRSGKSGGWREAFSAEHKQVFKQVSDGLLQRLGYELDDSW